jgi:ubiquinone/menaquinone biosynthesis C-methylase UbiE
MNFKHLFPTFRNRYRFVRAQVEALAQKRDFDRALNLGTGEGDYDRMLASHVRELVGCDVNEDDLQHARHLNRGVMNLRYEVNDALNLSYPSGNFDLVVSSEVIEHVGQPERMVQEISRVLAPGGWAVLTFPSREFPLTYDPVNRIWQWLRPTGKKPERLIAQGAYAFGHEYLIGSADFKQWAQGAGLEVVEFRPLSGVLVGLLEMYWTGVAQSIFKKNSRNVTADTEGALKVRPTDTSEPTLAKLTDTLLWIDRLWFVIGSSSVGKGVVLRKPL